jgi:hypothetical protein
MNLPPKLSFQDSVEEFELELDFHEREDGEVDSGTLRMTYFKEMSVSNIKRLSHTGRKKEDIRALVQQNYPRAEEMKTFVQGILLVIVVFIGRGVAEYGK